MPRHIMDCLCDTFLKHAHDVGHEKSLFVMLKYVSCASAGVVNSAGSADSDGRDVGRHRKPTQRTRLKKRREVLLVLLLRRANMS